MSLINWPASRADQAISVNDRGYIAGLRAMDLSPEEIRAVRLNDYVGQGKDPNAMKKAISAAQDLIPTLEMRNGVYVVDKPLNFDEKALIEELAIQSGNAIANVAIIRGDKIGFSGSPKIVNLLKEKNFFENLGYAPGDFEVYSVGDENASMLLGFKPKKPPHGATELIPPSVINAFWEVVHQVNGPK